MFLQLLQIACFTLAPATLPVAPPEDRALDGPVYPSYVADPRRPTFTLTAQTFSSTSIEGAGDLRWGIRMGSRFGLVRWTTEERGTFGIDAEVGFLGQFDLDQSEDNIGWDGLYAFDFAWRPRAELALRLGVSHDSAHVGDEYIQRVGRTRINYTREEFRLGASLDLTPTWRGYGEYGHSTRLRNKEIMAPGRWQAGLEFEAGGRELHDGFRPFAALDLSGFEEDDWEPNVALQLGYVRRSTGGSVWRAGLEFADGRSPMGEFFQDRESYLGLGIWIDP